MTLIRALLASLLGGPIALAVACGSGETTDDAEPTTTCPRVVKNGGGGIENPPDGVSLCPAGVCNYQSQEGCAADQACRPVYNADQTGIEPGCQPAGAGATGDACTSDTECAVGYLCAAARCRKICCGADWTACDAGESCIRQLDFKVGSDVVRSGADLCFPVGTCDVLDETACDDQPGRDCKLVDPTGAEACAPHSPEQLGEACSGPSVCDRGLSCVGGKCRRLCRAEECGEPACPESEGTCVHFDRDPPGVGECTPGF